MEAAMNLSIGSSQWPASPQLYPSSNSDIDDFALFIPNISLPEAKEVHTKGHISIYCEADKLNYYLSNGYLFVYSINTIPKQSDIINSSKRYYKLIKPF